MEFGRNILNDISRCKYNYIKYNFYNFKRFQFQYSNKIRNEILLRLNVQLKFTSIYAILNGKNTKICSNSLFTYIYLQFTKTQQEANYKN